MRTPTRMIASLAAVMASMGLQADWTDAACEIYPAGEDKMEKMVACVFSQRQGAVTITLDDGTVYDLVPEGDSPGNYRDQDGNAAYRQSGLGDQGLIFRMKEKSVYVYWNTDALNPQPRDESNPTWPYTTDEYDATTLLPCKSAGDEEFGHCPAGIMRMEGGEASITVKSPAGEEFTINFMKDYTNAANREIEAKLDGDMWTVKSDNGEVYQVPLAAIEGG